MNEAISKFLIAGDKFMPEIHLRQLGFTYNACGPFTKNKELNLNTQIEEQLLIKYYIIKDLILLKIQKMMEINVDLLQWSIDFLIKKTCGGTVKNWNISNKELVEDLHEPIVRKFNERRIHSPFIDNICGADLTVVQLINKFNKGFRFLLCYWYL